MNKGNPAEENHEARSNFVRNLVQRSKDLVPESISSNKIPKTIVQFWHNLDQLPVDVEECINTWKKTEELGFERLLFDKKKAEDFINQNLGLRHKQAYDKCYHPAMQSDYFRLCYIFVKGGCYIDIDDVYNGPQIQNLFNDSRLKIQPLCYDKSTHTMVSPKIFTKAGADATSWIFYFNNNPLISTSRHPLIEHVLAQATSSLENSVLHGLPEIQSTTGPGNLTKSIFDAITANAEIEQSLLVLCDWEDIAMTKWELSYRNDNRNWRHSNCQSYKEHSDNDIL
jgi:mannosyltransferase OCH1-like enzyme